MRFLLLACLAAAAWSADLKPGEQLPWCRVTLNQAATIDRDPPKLETRDGWYDETTHLLVTAEAAANKNAFGTIDPLPAERIVKVQPGAFAPQPMPAKAISAVNAARKRAEADQKPAP